MTSRLVAALETCLVEALDVPRERIIEFWVHRNHLGATVLTVRFDTSDGGAPPAQRVYEIHQVDGEDRITRPHSGMTYMSRDMEPATT